MKWEAVDSDYSYLEGTSLCLDDESRVVIKKDILKKPLQAVHLLGSGNYHYLSLLWLERIEEEFSLFLMDNHTDLSDNAFGEMLSCGSWVKEALGLPHLKKVYLWGVNPKYIEEQSPLDSKVMVVTDTKALGRGEKIYISIDLDVLGREYAATDWDQGQKSLPELLSVLEDLKDFEILGVDICGQKSRNPSNSEIELNETTVSSVMNSFC